MNNEHHELHQTREWASTTSLWLGVASIFLWEFSIFPILAIVFGVTGLISGSEKKLSTGIGLTLGVVYLIVRVASK